ncbi:hypothetical protein BDV96DRAFT_684632 [Lophiotrema nucula]|uniref:NmrA-like domain-containing protein n=1 Tax=Lophiotrema nucula TaxID=690887 RepID=A0A6A5ZIP7_9PLEO|nr:hypothetical protein BDV96DRAFT_684632 [Lophiotrema nucula]
MPSSNYISKVAVVGAGGNVGRFITEALLNTGKHSVTAITRADSKSIITPGAVAKHVDYNDPSTIVEALNDHDALVITLSGQAPIQETEEKLIRAAAEAGVPWILPNEWSPDTANEALVNDVFVFKHKVATRKLIEEIDKSAYISVATGFWYEYSLAIPLAYGIDIANRTATFFDEGETKISTSTWQQVGRAVAALLSLPIKTEDASSQACLNEYRNKVVYVSSFTIDQKAMWQSVLRVSGTKESDWTVSMEGARDRYETGLNEIKEGKRSGFAKMMFTRVFIDDGTGDFENGKGTLNSVLGLPNEDLDEATKRAIERVKEGKSF